MFCSFWLVLRFFDNQIDETDALYMLASVASKRRPVSTSVLGMGYVDFPSLIFVEYRFHCISLTAFAHPYSCVCLFVICCCEHNRFDRVI